MARVLVWRQPSESFCNLAATTDQPILPGPISVFIADRIENCSLIAKEGAKPGDHQVLKIGRRDPPPV